MNRLLFEKVGNGIWISHLDLMRLFQRAFKRGGMNLKHTQGFNPRAMVSIALPLSVGVESRCEILDFELVDQPLPFDEIRDRLNKTLPAGIRVLEVYDSAAKIKELTHLDCTICMEYDRGVPDDALEGIRQLFAGEPLLVEKKSKNGPVEQDIAPMIEALQAEVLNENEILLTARICAQNPSLNPALIPTAIAKYCPHAAPDFVRICRMDTRTAQGEVFR